MARREREQIGLSAASAAGGSSIDLDGCCWPCAKRPEARAQQRQMGRSLLQLSAELGWPLPSLTRPTARLAGGLGLGWLVLELASWVCWKPTSNSWVANQVKARPVR